MNSAIYKCEVQHTRTRPRRNAFSYSVYMWWLDLDELPHLAKRFRLFSHNRPNLHWFRDADFFKFLFYKDGGRKKDIAGLSQGYSSPTHLKKQSPVKEKVLNYLDQVGIKDPIDKIYLVANIRTLGYVFNPVVFYYCYAPEGELKYILCEVTNTYQDQKPYLLPIKDPAADTYIFNRTKDFYISPFISHQADFHFRFRDPGDDLFVVINAIREGRPVLTTSLKGQKVPLTNRELRRMLFEYPLNTFRVTSRIYYQAIKLILKRVPAYGKRKTDRRIVDEIH